MSCRLWGAGLGSKIPVWRIRAVPLGLVGFRVGIVYILESRELGSDFRSIDELAAILFFLEKRRNCIVGSDDTWFVHVVDGHVEVGQVLRKLGDEIGPQRKPFHSILVIALSRDVAATDLGDMLPRAGSLGERRWVEAPEGIQVLVYPVKELFYYDCIGRLCRLEPFVEARRRVSAADLSIPGSGGLEVVGAAGQTLVVSLASVDHELLYRVRGAEGNGHVCLCGIPCFRIVPEEIIGVEKQDEKDDADVTQDQPGRAKPGVDETQHRETATRRGEDERGKSTARWFEIEVVLNHRKASLLSLANCAERRAGIGVTDEVDGVKVFEWSVG